ncbi:MAG: hypothetical protein ACFN4W_10380, partial [Segatella oris]
ANLHNLPQPLPRRGEPTCKTSPNPSQGGGLELAEPLPASPKEGRADLRGNHYCTVAFQATALS